MPRSEGPKARRQSSSHEKHPGTIEDDTDHGLSHSVGLWDTGDGLNVQNAREGKCLDELTLVVGSRGVAPFRGG